MVFGDMKSIDPTEYLKYYYILSNKACSDSRVIVGESNKRV